MNLLVSAILNPTLCVCVCVTVAAIHHETVTCKNDGKPELKRSIATKAQTKRHHLWYLST